MKSSTRLILSLSLLIPILSGCSNSQAVEPKSRVYETTKPAATFSQQQLDSLLAPIALYPDSLLSHVLIASTYPLEVIEADRWVRNNSQLQGEKAVNAVDNKAWDPSVKALVAFPDVLRRMSEDLDWTQQMGDAFLDDEGRVMDSIQNLRDKAYAAGSLKNTDHVKVVREERVIMIEPAVERVVYVPVYDTRVVYGPWWWVDYPPVYWHRYSSQVYFSGSFYWGPRVYIGPSFHYSSCHWSNRRVVIVDHHHYNDYYHHRHNYYRSARQWNHNPVHRRGVAYYNEPVRARYNSNREPTRNAWDARQRSRDNAGVVSLNPNREQRANRNGNNTRDRNSVIRGTQQNATENTSRNDVFVNRSDAVRARLSNRQQETNQTVQTEGNNNNQVNSRQDVVRQRIESRQREPRVTNDLSRNTVQQPQENVQRTQEPVQRTQENVQRTQENNNDNSPRQIIRRNDDDSNNNARFERQRETRMENRTQSRSDMRRSGGSENSGGGGGRRIIRE